MELPDLVPGIIDSLITFNQYENKGFNFAIDYRFYLVNRNKFNIPDGFYIGPFLNFYTFKTKTEGIL